MLTVPDFILSDLERFRRIGMKEYAYFFGLYLLFL